MKKTYVYFLIPLVALIVFTAIYWNFSTGYEQELELKKQQVREERDKKVRDEIAARNKAIEDATIAAEQRKKERIAKEARDQAERDARQEAAEARNKATREADRLAKQAERLTKEVEGVKAEIAEVEVSKRRVQEEEKFLRDYVKQTQANAKSLLTVLEKVKAADEAAEAAAKAAAAAAAAAKK